jgi:MoaA/NifB/PqqE/SkfB family radical SAM enzyme
MGIAEAEACAEVGGGRLSLAAGDRPSPGEPTIELGDVNVRSSMNILSLSVAVLVLLLLVEELCERGRLACASESDRCACASCFRCDAFAALKTQ